jgi:hypothetical protein
MFHFKDYVETFYLEQFFLSLFIAYILGGVPVGQEDWQKFREPGHDGSDQCCRVRLCTALNICQSGAASGERKRLV